METGERGEAPAAAVVNVGAMIETRWAARPGRLGVAGKLALTLAAGCMGWRWAMAGRTWNADAADSLVDEHPSAYKDIDQVMADQADLVRVQHTLRQVFNYKGV